MLSHIGANISAPQALGNVLLAGYSADNVVLEDRKALSLVATSPLQVAHFAMGTLTLQVSSTFLNARHKQMTGQEPRPSGETMSEAKNLCIMGRAQCSHK